MLHVQQDTFYSFRKLSDHCFLMNVIIAVAVVLAQAPYFGLKNPVKQPCSCGVLVPQYLEHPTNVSLVCITHWQATIIYIIHAKVHSMQFHPLYTVVSLLCVIQLHLVLSTNNAQNEYKYHAVFVLQRTS